MKGDNYGKNTYGISSKYKRRRNTKRIRNRIIIVTVGVLLLAAIISGIVLLVNAISSSISNAQVEITVPVSTTVPATEPTTADPYPQPIIEDNNTAITQLDDIYIWNSKAYEKFSGDDNAAVNYAKTISDYKTALGDQVTVYNMVIPTAVEFGLPQRLKDEIATKSQADFVKKVYDSYSADVKQVNCYANLSAGAGEYIFFNTDDMWTGLGAYKAYLSFASVADVKPVSLDDCTKNTINNYLGYFANYYDSSDLWENPDTIDYYVLPNSVSAYAVDSDGEKIEASVYDKDAEGDTVFISGTNPLFVMSSDCNTGKKIAVVKEYFGNVFAPYLAANYDETHVIDYRRWSGNLKEYCAENGITEVLFINSTKFACDSSALESLNSLK